MDPQWQQENNHIFRTPRSRGEHQRRPKRHQLPVPLDVLTRPFGMRFYSFHLIASNFSASGFFLETRSELFIPFDAGTILQATVDIHCRVFQRPLHITLRVARKAPLGDGRTGFGVQIMSIETSQKEFFWQGLAKFGPIDSFE